MIGLGWRDRDYGDAIAVDDASGRLLRIAQGAGIGAGHGRRHSYLVRIRKPEHPIMQGIPSRWMHATDELYHGQRGPALDMTVLASAFSDPRQAGSGQHEPLVWVIPYGKGRVVTNLMGHHWPGQEHRNSLHCVGFQTIFTRSVEWLASNRVTLPCPIVSHDDGGCDGGPDAGARARSAGGAPSALQPADGEQGGASRLRLLRSGGVALRRPEPGGAGAGAFSAEPVRPPHRSP